MFLTTERGICFTGVGPLQRIAITIICGVATRLAGLVLCTNARADNPVPPPMPPVMRNVLMWGQVEGGHMIDVKTAKSLNANVINVAAVPHGVGTWIGSVKPLPAYKMCM